MKLSTNICHVMGIAKRFSRSQVKGQGHEQTNGRGTCFDDVASKLTCFCFLCFVFSITIVTSAAVISEQGDGWILSTWQPAFDESQ